MSVKPPKIPALLTTIRSIDRPITQEDPLSTSHLDAVTFPQYTDANFSISDSLISGSSFSAFRPKLFDTVNCLFKQCDFTTAKLPDSSWHTVTIDNSRCTGMQLHGSVLRNVRFNGSKMDITNFRFSKLEDVVFTDCLLDDADFYNAKLKNVSFVNCTINNCTFQGATMKNVDLSKSQLETIKGGSSLKGATISYDQLMKIAPYLAAEAGIKII